MKLRQHIAPGIGENSGAAFFHCGRGKRLVNADRIKLAAIQCRFHLRKRHLDELDLTRTGAVFVDPRHGHQMNDIVERIDGDRFFLQDLWRS